MSPLIFVFALLGFLWQIGPVAISALFAIRSATALGAWVFVLLQIGIIGFAAWIWYLLLVVDPDAQAPIALFIFVPMYEYMAVGLCAGLAAALGWRMRGPAPELPDISPNSD